MSSDQKNNDAGTRWRLILTIIFGIAWTLFASEIYLRVFNPIPMLPRYIQATNFGIRGNMPNQSYKHRTPDYIVELRTNSKGIRADEEFGYSKPAGVKRIVLLGDSFGMGYGVNLEDTFTAQMSERLKQSGVDNQVINLSVSGHGNTEQLVMLRNEGFRYEPDIILIAWHRSDLKDNLRTGLFALENGQLEQKRSVYLPAVKTREFLFSFVVYRWLAGNSHFYNWIREKVAVQTNQLLVVLQGSRQKKNEAPDQQTEVSNKPALNVAMTLAVLDQIELECNQYGGQMLIFDIPSRYSLSSYKSYFPLDENGGTHGWHVVNPVPIFEAAGGKLLYWSRSHNHFTPLGCQLSGHALADYILEHGLLEKSDLLHQ